MFYQRISPKACQKKKKTCIHKLLTTKRLPLPGVVVPPGGEEVHELVVVLLGRNPGTPPPQRAVGSDVCKGQKIYIFFEGLYFQENFI